MHSHFWEYTKGDAKEISCVIEVFTYSSLRSMQRGIERHRISNAKHNTLEDPLPCKASSVVALCRTWVETVDKTGHEFTVSRIFLHKGSTIPVIAHECHHAAVRNAAFQAGFDPTKNVTYDKDLEEETAMLLELFLSEILKWISSGFLNEAPQTTRLPSIAEISSQSLRS